MTWRLFASPVPPQERTWALKTLLARPDPIGHHRRPSDGSKERSDKRSGAQGYAGFFRRFQSAASTSRLLRTDRQ